MSDLRDAARQALVALKCMVEAYEMQNMIRADINDAEDAIAALKAALEQPEQDCAECNRWQRAVLEQGEVIEQLKAALEQPERAQRMREAGYIRRPTLREMAALEQPEQEPVAWRYALDVSVEGPRWIYSEIDPAEWRDPDMLNWAIEPLYTHPPRREWQSLSEKEIRQIALDTPIEGTNFARAIEAKLKELNHG